MAEGVWNKPVFIERIEGDYAFSVEQFDVLQRRMVTEGPPSHLIYYYSKRYQLGEDDSDREGDMDLTSYVESCAESGKEDNVYHPARVDLLALARHLNQKSYSIQSLYESLWIARGDISEVCFIFQLVDSILQIMTTYGCSREDAIHYYSINEGDMEAVHRHMSGRRSGDTTKGCRSYVCQN